MDMLQGLKIRPSVAEPMFIDSGSLIVINKKNKNSFCSQGEECPLFVPSFYLMYSILQDAGI